MTADPNILFITADQWRGDCLSVLGHPTVKTPHLDALAADGLLFSRHFAQCAPCGPSRASLYAGMYMMNHRSVRNGVPLDARFTNIALEARKAGYDPALIGYTDTSPDPRRRHPNDPDLRAYTGVLPGFTQMVPGSGDSTNSAWRQFLIAKGYDVPMQEDQIIRQAPHDAEALSRGPTFAPAFYSAEDSETAFMVDRALEFVTKHKSRPWFLHLSLCCPHPPFVAPAPYNALYHPDDVPAFRGASSPEEEARQHPYAAYMTRHHLDIDGHDPDLHPTEETAMRQLRATYYGLMAEVDHHIGRLLAVMKQQDQYDNTIIVFTSDHGEQLWDHWMLGKETYFDQSFHVPLIVRAPGSDGDSARGVIVDAWSEHVDVMPTVLSLIGSPIPLQCDGRSLAPFLAGGSLTDWRQEVHWELDFRDHLDGIPELELGVGLEDCALSVIRDHRYKYVHFAALPPLLFNLEDDPDELNNVAQEPEYTHVALSYAQKLLSWRMTSADRTLTGLRLGRQGVFECPPERRLPPVSDAYPVSAPG